jgi:hypothetical protein
MKELERQALLADQRSVQTIIQNLPDSDPVGRLSFSSRLAEIERRLKELGDISSTRGSVALLFGGGPVIGSRAIDADFATRVLHEFQDLVTKTVASDELGKLGSRGRIPMRTVVNLAITDVIRGSVGFALEESGPNEEIADTAVKMAIGDVARIVISTGSANQEEFEGAVEGLDSRLLVSLRNFFRVLDEKHALIRIVEGTHDLQLDAKAISRGRERVDRIEIDEQESEQIIGELLGILPDSKKFEMRLLGSGTVISGRVAAAYAPRYLSLIETPDQSPVGKVWRTKMKIREVRERNKPPRNLYTLIGLLDQIKMNPPALPPGE